MGSAGASPSQPSAPNDTCLFALLDESIQTLGEERLYSADRQLRDELSAKLKGIPPPDSSLSGYRPQPPNARRVLPSERTTPRSPDCLGSRTPPVPGTVVGTHPDFSGPIGRCPVCNAALILLDANGRLLPRHRVSNIVSLPYESLRGVTATASLPYEVRGFLARIGARVRRLAIHIGVPDRGIEPYHRHDDVVIGAGTFAAAILLVAGWRRIRAATHHRCHGEKSPSASRADDARAWIGAWATDGASRQFMTVLHP